VKLTIAAAIQARWGHRVDDLIHTHAWTIEAVVEGPADASRVMPADELEDILSEAVKPWNGKYLTDVDVGLLGSSATYSCFCPTTERDLADGIGPSVQLRDAGSPLTLGSDSHAIIDLFEEMRAVELNERLATQERGHWSAAELLKAATIDGHRSIGYQDAGAIRVGARADLVAVRLDTVRTAGTGGSAETAVFAATAADVSDVVVSGNHLVADSKHVHLDVPAQLTTSIEAVTG